MRNVILLLTLSLSMTQCFSQNQSDKPFSLADYYGDNMSLDDAVNQVYNSLSPSQRVAQMLVSSLGKLGKPYPAVEPLIVERKIGGILFLSGNPDEFATQIDQINQLSQGFPLMMSMDAEPSLFNRRMPGTPEVPATADLKTTDEVVEVTNTIDKTLRTVGFQHNYAPVIDMSPENEAIGNRAFGSDSASIVPMALEFVRTSQQDQIIATVKHFPGHGRVSGDTHKKLVYIDGELTEVGLYKPMIEAGVLSIMVGHIAVENNEKYNTNGLPSTLSKTIVTDLLRTEMGFQGLIITDALNMGAVASIENAPFEAAKAGCDLILMPPNESETHSQLLQAIETDEELAKQIEASVKRIIRAKLCLGMNFS